ncbi:MAG TPA: TIM barrel protein [Planctomycetaceae bacterium]|jgi:sugar phosphate isomerase/epimerase|nr:TIM barrel protein [Planctomycetaceae bacterium]
MPSQEVSESAVVPRVLLSAFADEAANRKTALEQLSALAAIGLRYYSPRFIDVDGTGTVKHVVDLDKNQYKTLKALNAEYGFHVTSIGARLGKVKLRDEPDKSHNKFVPFAQYLETELAATMRAAHELETKLIRGFSFYPPLGADPMPYVPQAVDQLGQIADLCAREGLIYGLEIEPNLVGSTGKLMALLARQVNRPNLVLIFDGGNVAAQNKNPIECFQEYQEMRPYLGWMHVKDYRIDPELGWTGVVDEERLRNFVPADCGDAGHEMVLKDLKAHLPQLEERIQKLGAPGFFLETEPHLKGGGQFGGFSGPDGMGVAVRSLCRLLDYVGIGYSLRGFDDIRKARGF